MVNDGYRDLTKDGKDWYYRGPDSSGLRGRRYMPGPPLASAGEKNVESGVWWPSSPASDTIARRWNGGRPGRLDQARRAGAGSAALKYGAETRWQAILQHA